MRGASGVSEAVLVMCAALAMSVNGEAGVSVPYLSRFTGISGVTLFLGAAGLLGAPLAMVCSSCW